MELRPLNIGTAALWSVHRFPLPIGNRMLPYTSYHISKRLSIIFAINPTFFCKPMHKFLPVNLCNMPSLRMRAAVPVFVTPQRHTGRLQEKWFPDRADRRQHPVGHSGFPRIIRSLWRAVWQDPHKPAMQEQSLAAMHNRKRLHKEKPLLLSAYCMREILLVPHRWHNIAR